MSVQVTDPVLDEPQYQKLALSKVPPGFRGRSGLVVLLWQFVQATLFAWSPQPAYFWRRWLLRLFGAQVGEGVAIRQTARVTYPWKVTIGDHCWIGDHAELYSLASISIGHDTVISQRTYLCAATHDHRDIAFTLIGRPIVVEDQAWVAASCFVHPGVRIGRGAIVSAFSNVRNDVAPGAIVDGNPATFRRQRDPVEARPR